MTRSPSTPPTRCISFTPPARPASPRAWCATMAAMRWRCTSHAHDIRRGSRASVPGRLRCRLGGRPSLYRLRAAAAGCTTIMYEGKPVGTPDPGAFWRCARSTACRVMFTAPTALRAIRQQDPEAAASRHDMSSWKRCIWPANAATRQPPSGRRKKCACRWSTITGRPNRLGDHRHFKRLGLFPIKPGSGGRPSPG